MKVFHLKKIALLALLILQVSCQTTPFEEGEEGENSNKNCINSKSYYFTKNDFTFEVCETGDYLFNPAHSLLLDEENKGCRNNDNYTCPEYTFTIKDSSESKIISPSFTPSLLHLKANTKYTLSQKKDDPYFVDKRSISFSLRKVSLAQSKKTPTFQDFVNTQDYQSVTVTPTYPARIHLQSSPINGFSLSERTLKINLQKDPPDPCLYQDSSSLSCRRDTSNYIFSVTLCLSNSYQYLRGEKFITTLDENFRYKVNQKIRRQSFTPFQIVSEENETFTCQVFYYPHDTTIELAPLTNSYSSRSIYIQAEKIETFSEPNCSTPDHVKFLAQEIAPGEKKRFDFTPCQSGSYFIDFTASDSEHLKMGLYQGGFPLNEKETASSFFSSLLEKRAYSLEIENTSSEVTSTFDLAFKPSSLYHDSYFLLTLQDYLQTFQLNQIPLESDHGIDSKFKVLHQRDQLTLPETAQYQLDAEKKYSVTVCLTDNYFFNDRRITPEVIRDYFSMEIDGSIENERTFEADLLDHPCYQFVVKDSTSFLLQPTLGALGPIPVINTTALLSQQEDAFTYQIYLSITEL
jgi:hypothetical protein